ncbi:ABC transporter permease [Malacoplasma penetrans]|uniref:Sugar ABC transporter permease n=1 Tax=Malacoplasma penetrans (strain HF-2) TaxID=272633 RepID=Q8EVH7_MALP2|nr:ABC transporter permease [Malacoplasma penetrans]RXY96918.1 ABC transporter permease [Malacoplasma penetrans]BAC44377.1 sugar ABC transporter permease [Malacoplasma penetrans HF-2]
MFDVSQWFILAPALIFGILSGYLSERVGIVNIAINGMMIFGAVFFNIFSNVFYQAFNEGSGSYNSTFFLTMLISSALGVGVGALFGFAVIKLKCDHVIGGTGINLIAPGIGLIISDNAPVIFNGQSSLANKYTFNPDIRVGSVSGEAIICLVISLVIIAAIYVFMNFTKYGLRYRSIGENPNAADAQGINVIKYKWIGVLVVGALASFAGCLFSYYIPGSAFAGDVNGLGFIALALLIVSSWKISPSVIIGFLFSALYVFASNALSLTQENRYILKIIPFALTLVVMVLFGRFSIGPKSAGKHFNKSAR